MVFENWETIVYTCIFLLPGFISKELIDSIIPPKFDKELRFIFQCIILSIVNLALWAWLDMIIFQNFKETNLFYLILAAVNIGSATITGIILGILKYYNIPRKWFPFLQLNNSIPTAWDYFYNQKKSYFVVVSLKSGKTIYGLYSEKSFSSSESSERDLYIEKTYKYSKKEPWKEIPRNKGIYIDKNEIETIEFYSMEEKK